MDLSRRPRRRPSAHSGSGPGLGRTEPAAEAGAKGLLGAQEGSWALHAGGPGRSRGKPRTVQTQRFRREVRGQRLRTRPRPPSTPDSTRAHPYGQMARNAHVVGNKKGEGTCRRDGHLTPTRPHGFPTHRCKAHGEDASETAGDQSCGPGPCQDAAQVCVSDEWGEVAGEAQGECIYPPLIGRGHRDLSEAGWGEGDSFQFQA